MSATCPLCGLRYAGQSLLDLHIREDHAQRERGREPPPTPANPPAPSATMDDPSTAPGDPPATEAGPPAEPAGLPGWAAAARRALSRLTRAGRETADRARKAA
jgi:hypothetical protein